jgi:ketosteroid isomerase-like protein
MSEDTAVIKRAYEAFQRGDIATVLDCMADDIQWETPTIRGASFGGRRQGKAAVAEFFRLLNEAEEIPLFEPREFIAQGDRIVVLGRVQVRVRATGRTAESPWIHVFRMQNGVAAEFFEMYDTAVAERAYQQAASA